MSAAAIKAIFEAAAAIPVAAAPGPRWGATLSNGFEAAAPAASAAAKDGSDSDSDDDMFGSDSDDEANEERMAAIALKHKLAKEARTGKVKVVIGRSTIVLSIKPFDDETDLDALAKNVRAMGPAWVQGPGATHANSPDDATSLLWGAMQQEPMAFGIKKLVAMCTIYDDDVSVDDLIEQIQDDFADDVQSIDIDAFNKV